MPLHASAPAVYRIGASLAEHAGHLGAIASVARAARQPAATSGRADPFIAFLRESAGRTLHADGSKTNPTSEDSWDVVRHEVRRSVGSAGDDEVQRGTTRAPLPTTTLGRNLADALVRSCSTARNTYRIPDLESAQVDAMQRFANELGQRSGRFADRVASALTIGDGGLTAMNDVLAPAGIALMRSYDRKVSRSTATRFPGDERGEADYAAADRLLSSDRLVAPADATGAENDGSSSAASDRTRLDHVATIRQGSSEYAAFSGSARPDIYRAPPGRGEADMDIDPPYGRAPEVADDGYEAPAGRAPAEERYGAGPPERDEPTADAAPVEAPGGER